MKIKEYQEIMLMDSGSTTYVSELGKRLNIKGTLSYSDAYGEILKKLDIKPIEKLPRLFFIGKKIYMFDNDLLGATFDQFSLMDQILAEEDNVQNLHKLLALYLRPMSWLWRIKKFNINTQEKISLYIRDNLEIEDAFGLMLFFYNYAIVYIKYMSQHFLNLQNLVGQNLSINPK